MLTTVLQSWALLSRRQRFYLSLLGLTRVAVNGLDVVGIAFVGVLASVAVSRGGSFSSLGILGTISQLPITSLLILIAAVFVAKAVLGVYLAKLTYSFLARVESDFSTFVAQRIFWGEWARFRKMSRVDVEWALLRSTGIAFQGVLGQAVSFLAEASLALLVLVLLFVAEWQSALAVSAYLLVILLLFQVFSRSAMRKAGVEFSEGSRAVGDAISDLSAGFKEIRISGKMDFFLQRFGDARKSVARAGATNSYLVAVPRLIIEMGLIAGAIGFVAFQVTRQGDLSASAEMIGIFLMGSLRLMSAVLPLHQSVMSLTYQSETARSAQALVREFQSSLSGAGTGSDDRAVGQQQTGARTSSPSGVAIAVRDVSFRFEDSGSDSPALTDINLDIQSGSFTAFVGPSGSGKSTLANLMTGMLSPSAGRITLDGREPEEFILNNPGSVSYLPQRPGIIKGTIEQNIALGLSPEQVDEERLWEAIVGARLEEVVLSLPRGVKSDLGEQFDAMSGGQLQRVGLARALYTRPRLVLLDEVTSALDAEVEDAVVQTVQNLGESTTVVVIAHKLSTIKNADIVHVVYRGRITDSGKFDAIRGRNPLIEKYVSLSSVESPSS